MTPLSQVKENKSYDAKITVHFCAKNKVAGMYVCVSKQCVL